MTRSREPASPKTPKLKRAGVTPPVIGTEPDSPKVKDAGVLDVKAIAKAFKPFKGVQSGRVLGLGYLVGGTISSGAEGDVFQAQPDPNFSSEAFEGAKDVANGLAPRSLDRDLALKRIRVTKPAVLRHALQEVAAVFHAQSKHTEEAGDPGSTGHPNIAAYLDWFAGPRGLESEVWIVMRRSEFTVSDMIYSTLNLRTQYDKKAEQLRKQHSAPPGTRPSRAEPQPQVVTEPDSYRITEREVAKVLLHMLRALAFLNRCEVMHRDIKVENMLWQCGVPEGRYQLTDFGVALSPAAGLFAKRSDEAGTVWTMAPEVIGRRGHGPNCDTWSLGVVLFELVALDKPFNSKELLGYRNSPEAAQGGSFWPAMLAPDGARRLQAPSGGPTSPASPARRAQLEKARVTPDAKTTPKERKRLSGQSSTSSLPQLVAKEGGGSSSSRPGSAARSDTPSLPPLSPQASGFPAAGDPASPTSPVSPWNQDRRKSAFLAKRCRFPWFYCEALRTLIFEDMLEEDAERRPVASTLMETGAVKALLRGHGLIAEEAEIDSVSRGSGDDVSPEVSAPASVAAALKHVTGEAFYSILLAERRMAAQQAAQQAQAAPKAY